MDKKILKAMLSSITLLGITPIIIRVIGNKFFDLAMNPQSDKTHVFNAPHNFINRNKFSLGAKNLDTKELNIKDLYIISTIDDLKLHAKIFHNKNKTNKWVVVCHGYGGIDVTAEIIIHEFFKMGFNVLIPELRGFGETGGKYIGWGWQDRIDIVSWIKTILKINKNLEIILYGISMGGATVMATCGENLPKNVKLAIEDSGYSSLWKEFLYQYKLIYKAPHFPVLNLASIVTKIKANFSFKEVDMTKQVAKSKIPIMFIHGEKDTFVPTWMVDEVYNATSVPKKKLIIPKSGHVEGLATKKNLYWNNIKKFINLYL